MPWSYVKVIWSCCFLIKESFICSVTPQQNGVVERKHRHLLETSRALYLQSKVPIIFWGECLLPATYLINRTPLKSINFISPYEKLYKIEPNLDPLRIFGCLCFIATSTVGRTKFDSKSEPCVLIGYPSDQKAYKVLNLVTNKIITSSDIDFYEKHFPFHYNPNPKASYSTKFFLPIATDIVSDLSSITIPKIFFPQNIIPSPTTNQSSSIPLHNSFSILTDSGNDTESVHLTDLIQLNSSVSTQPVRRSSRASKSPSHLDDYVCNTSTSTITHWCNLVTFDSLPVKQQEAIISTLELIEPTSFKEDVSDQY